MNPRPRHYEECGLKGEVAPYPLLREYTEARWRTPKLTEHSAKRSATRLKRILFDLLERIESTASQQEAQKNG